MSRSIVLFGPSKTSLPIFDAGCFDRVFDLTLTARAHEVLTKISDLDDTEELWIVYCARCSDVCDCDMAESHACREQFLTARDGEEMAFRDLRRVVQARTSSRTVCIFDSLYVDNPLELPYRFIPGNGRFIQASSSSSHFYDVTSISVVSEPYPCRATMGSALLEPMDLIMSLSRSTTFRRPRMFTSWRVT